MKKKVSLWLVGLLVFLIAGVLGFVFGRQRLETTQNSQTIVVSSDTLETGKTVIEAETPAPVPSAEPSPAETPTPTPEAEEEDTLSLRAQEILDTMTEREKIYQLFVVYPDAVTGVTPTLSAGELTAQGLSQYPVCGFVYSANNLQSDEQVLAMIAGEQASSRIPLLTCVDEEGGRVQRLSALAASSHRESMFSYREAGSETAYANAAAIAASLRSLGLNTDFAPVADTWSNSANTVIGDRAYSDDFEETADLVAAAVEGFHSEGIVCTLKHFPGHGDTYEDSHSSTAVVSKTLEELREQELKPFAAGIAAGADMVMIGHLTIPAIDSVPATFSKSIVTDLLRGELGFDGVVITDALGMTAATEIGSGGEICVRALEAGCDILLGPENLPTAAETVTAAVESGRLTWERIDESVLRILSLKLRMGLME